MSKEEYSQTIKNFVKAAVGFERTHGYPAEMMCAQFGQESGWGVHPSGDFNYFGITYNPKRHSALKWCPTHEELTDAGIAALPPDERATIRSKVATKRTDSKGNRIWRIELDRKFASYLDLQSAMKDKASLIMDAPRYRAAWTAYTKDMHYETLMNGVEAAGYATGSGYAAALKRILATNTNGIRDLIELARAGKLNGETVVTA